MKAIFKFSATLLVMLCTLLVAERSFAQIEFGVVDPKLYGKLIDLQSLNDLNNKAAQLSDLQRKDSFKLYILSSPFEINLTPGNQGVLAKPLINGLFQRDLLKSIVGLVISEMDFIDRLSPFSFASTLIGEPKWDVNSVWDCLWMKTLLPNQEYIRSCSDELVQKTNMDPLKSLQLVGSMATVFKTISLFSVLHGQVAIGEDSSEIFTELWKKSNSFYGKFVSVESISGFKTTFYVGVLKLGAFTDNQKRMYTSAIQLIRQAVESGDMSTAKIYRDAFQKRGIFIPVELRGTSE